MVVVVLVFVFIFVFVFFQVVIQVVEVVVVVVVVIVIGSNFYDSTSRIAGSLVLRVKYGPLLKNEEIGSRTVHTKWAKGWVCGRWVRVDNEEEDKLYDREFHFSSSASQK